MADLTGIAGVALILLAYFLNLFGKIPQTGRLYLLMNLAGAGLACISSILIRSLPFTVLEATWAMVSLIALLRKDKTETPR